MEVLWHGSGLRHFAGGDCMQDLHSAALAKQATSGGLDGWDWNELKALLLSRYVGLAWILRLVEDTGQWPEGPLDADITKIMPPLGFCPIGSHSGLVLFLGCGHCF